MKTPKPLDLMQKMQDSTEYFRDSLMKSSALPNSVKEMQEYLKTLGTNVTTTFNFPDPAKEVLERIVASQQNIMKTFQISEHTKMLRERGTEIQKLMDAGRDNALRLSESQKTLSEFGKLLASSQQNALRAFEPLKEMEERYKVSMQGIQKNIDASIKLFNQTIANSFPPTDRIKFDRQLSMLKIENLKAYETLNTKFDIHGENTIDASVTPIPAEIQSLITKIIDDAFTQTIDRRLDSSVDKVIASIESIKDTKLQSLVKNLIYPLLYTLMGILLNVHLTHYLAAESLILQERQVRKEIQNFPPILVGEPTQLNSYRYISTKNIDVHLDPSAKSSVLGHISLGQELLLKKKKKAWSLVEWRSSEKNAVLQGWVFSRYLSKLQSN